MTVVFQLVKLHSVNRDLLPPKRYHGNLSKQLIDQRRLQLESYLQKLIHRYVHVHTNHTLTITCSHPHTHSHSHSHSHVPTYIHTYKPHTHTPPLPPTHKARTHTHVHMYTILYRCDCLQNFCVFILFSLFSRMCTSPVYIRENKGK